MKAVVVVTLKKEVLDPQGKAIQHACEQLGYDAVGSVRQGKYFEVELAADGPEAAQRLLEELSAKLLSNPVIEDHRIVSVEP